MTVTDAQKKATANWEKKNYDKILLRLPKGIKEELQKKADYEKISLNKYINNVLLYKLSQKELESYYYTTSDGSKMFDFSNKEKKL